jgi:hypothetical protein
MISARKIVTSLLLVALLFVEGCTKKKAGLPPKTIAPTIAATLPDSIPTIEEEPQEPEPQVAETPPPPPPQKTKPKKTSRTSTAKKTNPPANPASAPSQPTTKSNGNNATVASVHPPSNPADTPPQTVIAAAVPNSQVIQQKEDTSKMIDATENALKGINRSLSDDEKSMKSQIQSYLQQSRKATNDGDYERAFNLAKKAQLLVDALLKK